MQINGLFGFILFSTFFSRTFVKTSSMSSIPEIRDGFEISLKRLSKYYEGIYLWWISLPRNLKILLQISHWFLCRTCFTGFVSLVGWSKFSSASTNSDSYSSFTSSLVKICSKSLPWTDSANLKMNSEIYCVKLILTKYFSYENSFNMQLPYLYFRFSIQNTWNLLWRTDFFFSMVYKNCTIRIFLSNLHCVAYKTDFYDPVP